MIWTLLIIIGWLILFQILEKRKYKNPSYVHNLERIYSFFDTIQKLNDYVTWVQRDEIKSRYFEVGKFFNKKSNFYKKEKSVEEFNSVFQNFDKYIEDYNLGYIRTQKRELSEYFDDIEGKKLDEQQRTAVITDEYSNLIIAGAGSGKTLTIVGKVKYLLENKNVKPENILLLSFTKKTVTELNERLQNIGLGTRATTFHKLGYDLIKKHDSMLPSISNENTLINVINEFLDHSIFSNSEALEAYITYVACYMNIPEENDNYDSFGNKLETEKGADFQTLKAKCGDDELNKVAISSLDTIQGEKVKSFEELTIANFLYLNGIAYEYEKKYPFSSFVYAPDFYLPEYDIYLEHFGVDESNRAKWLTPFNEKKYVEEMVSKRETHKENNTKLLETYSYYNKNNVLLEKLREMLENENVTFKPRDTEELYNKVIDTDNKFGKEITSLLMTFINLCKSRKLSYDNIISLFSDKQKTANNFVFKRQLLFLKFAMPILKKYNQFLRDQETIDFNDMINHATDLVKEKRPDFPYQYIIIDEYQDISFARFNLIKEIRSLSKARIICVGDDWQSIYRFTGSDISLFSNFEKHVGKHEKLFIEQTYRNSQSLIDITSNYIQKNSKQLKKNPKSKKKDHKDPLRFTYYSQTNAEQIFINEIQRLVKKDKSKSILVLGRHKFDINEFIRLTPNSRIKYYERSDKLEIKGLEELNIKFITVHKSKGLEADNVIVINLKNHLLGFPNKMTDDPMLSLLLSDNETYRFAEERRLFYVALTRTKNEVVLLIPNDVSLFAEELVKDNKFLMSANNEQLSRTNCPYCITGNLVIRESKSAKNQFLGCSNYPSCDQTFNNIAILDDTVLCSSCKSGFMVKRKGKFGNFLGCTNYPKCKNAIKLERQKIFSS